MLRAFINSLTSFIVAELLEKLRKAVFMFVKEHIIFLARTVQLRPRPQY